MLKLSENPPIIWPEEAQLSDFEGTWWVAHTKSRNEKAFAWQLQKHNINYFLPLTMKVTKKKGRTFRSLLPLFSGYVFFCGSDNNRLEALRTNRIANIIIVNNQQRLVKELEPILKIIRQGQRLMPHKYIRTGQRCQVTAGPLIGTEGIAVRTQHHTRLVLQVDILGQATSVEIDTDMIEIIDE